MKKIKILIDLRSILPGGLNGGAKLFVLGLLRSLIDNYKDEFSFIFVVRLSAKNELEKLKPNSIIPLLIDQDISYFNKLLLQISNKFKYYLCKHDILFSPFGAMCLWNKNIPTISIIYDLQYKFFPQFFSHEERKLRNEIFINQCIRSDLIITISDTTKKDVMHYNKNISNQIKTIYIQNSFVIPERHKTIFLEKFADKFKIKAKSYFLYPANFWKHKNHKLLVSSFIEFLKINSNFVLVFTGEDCYEKNEIKKIVNKNDKYKHNFIFLPYLPKKELNIIFMNAKGIIFPTLFEGFGIPLIESINFGLPVAYSNIDAHIELISQIPIFNKRYLFSFDPKNKNEIIDAFIFLARAPNLKKPVSFMNNIANMTSNYVAEFRYLKK